MAYDWPGNVRELVRVVEGAIARAGGLPILYPTHLPPQLRANVARRAFVEETEPSVGECTELALPRALPSWKNIRERLEHEYMQRLAVESGGSIETACRVSGLSRARIYEVLKKHGLSLGD